jgi:hypothetical protein
MMQGNQQALTAKINGTKVWEGGMKILLLCHFERREKSYTIYKDGCKALKISLYVRNDKIILDGRLCMSYIVNLNAYNYVNPGIHA